MHICLTCNGQLLVYPWSLTHFTLDFILFINLHDTSHREFSTDQYKFQKMSKFNDTNTYEMPICLDCNGQFLLYSC